ncbi:hypothetical protein BH18PSE1_BH18PSE1_10620 [soil metagenome]
MGLFFALAAESETGNVAREALAQHAGGGAVQGGGKGERESS